MIACLTVRENQGQNATKSRYLTGASHTLNGVAGFDSPYPEAHKSRATPAAFLCQYGSPYNGRAVRGAARLAGPQASLSTRTVPPTRLTAGERSYRPHPEDTTMANATSTPKIRAKNTQARLHADGSTDTITWVRESTVIKRLRRALAKKNHSLLITREGTSARRELGEYAVLDSDGHPLQTHAELAALGRFLGVLADDERIDPPLNRGWLYYIGRYERVVVDGIEANYARPITRQYTTEAAARRAVEHLTDRDGLVICSFDASIREAT